MRGISLWWRDVRSRCFRRLLGPHARGIVVEDEGLLFAVGPRDYAIGKAFRFRGNPMKNEIEFLSRRLSDDDSLLVIGGHIGALAVPLSFHCRDVVVLEPNPESLDAEGSEYHALKGMQRLLTSCRCLWMEFMPHHLRFVAGVEVAPLVELLLPHFSAMEIGFSGERIEKTDIHAKLQRMYESNRCEDGLLFLK